MSTVTITTAPATPLPPGASPADREATCPVTRAIAAALPRGYTLRRVTAHAALATGPHGEACSALLPCDASDAVRRHDRGEAVGVVTFAMYPPTPWRAWEA